MNLRRICESGNNSLLTDVGLLFLRVSFGVVLLLKHGMEKITGFNELAQHFPGPLYLGFIPSLTIATASDFVAAALIIAGIATRPAAVFTFGNVALAWAFVHHFQYFGINRDLGEIDLLYVLASLSVML